MAIDVRVDAPAWRKRWPGAKREARLFLSEVSLLPEFQPSSRGETVIVLAGDTQLRRLNLRFRGKDRATNVLSFPDPQAPPGGMVLALETLENEAKAQGKSFVNHVKHMILHGFLHLLGYDHQTKADARLMERLEIAILGDMGIPNPYVIETKTRA